MVKRKLQGSDKLVPLWRTSYYSLEKIWKTTKNRVEQALDRAWVDQAISSPLTEPDTAAAKLQYILWGIRIRPEIGVFLIGNET